MMILNLIINQSFTFFLLKQDYITTVLFYFRKIFVSKIFCRIAVICCEQNHAAKLPDEHRNG